MNRLAEIAARKVEIRSLLESDGKIEFEKIETELKALETEETELRKRMEVAKGIETGIIEPRVVASTKTIEAAVTDKYDTNEYRKAFMSYVTSGAKSDLLEFRAAGVTNVGDIGAVIPTKIVNQIVERMETIGRIWRKVSKTSVHAQPTALELHPVLAVAALGLALARAVFGGQDGFLLVATVDYLILGGKRTGAFLVEEAAFHLLGLPWFPK